MAHIGLEEEERSRPQRVVVDLAIEGAPAGGGDGELGRALRREVRSFLAGGRFVLVETTILKLARLVFERAPARRVRVRFHKFILPGTDHVAIDMTFRPEEVR
jgi:dihydroneopterin aldolase